MASLDNLGYSTYVLGTIRAVTECERILVYNKNSFIGNPNYSRINLYNLEDIFERVLYLGNGEYNSGCLVLSRELSNPSEDSQNVPFVYECENDTTPDGFNVIIYLSRDNNPTGYTEFLNTQGKISNYVWIYLKFKIDINQITLELNNSLYKVRSRLGKESLIGPELWQFSSSQSIVERASKVRGDQKYTSHLSAFLENHNRSGIYMSDRTLLPSESMITLNLVKDIDIFDGEEYSNFQVGYYQDDIVLYAWTYSNMYYYRITSLIDQTNYKYTRQEDGEWIDTIGRYDEREVSKDLLYCAGKYLVFKILYQTYSIQALFDTTLDTWLRLESPNPIVDPLDKTLEIIELPKASLIQSYDAALEYMPGLENTYIDLRQHIQTERSLDVYKKVGDWYFIKWGDLVMASCMSYLVYMTEDEARSCIVLGNNTILIPSDDYYTIYHGVRNKEYYTEKARGTALVDLEIRPGVSIRYSSSQPREYLNYYKTSEIAIVHKSELVFESSILDSFRHQPLYTYEVPERIIGGIGSLIFYINQNNEINYL